MNPAAMPSVRILVLVLTLGLGAPSGAFAHDSPARPIADLTRRINANPDSVPLYLLRGELRRITGDLAGAGADYDQVERRAPGHPRLGVCRAALALDAGDAAAARGLLDQALAAQPGDPGVLRLRARSFTALGDRRSAIADLSAAIDALENPHPDLYLDRARLQVAEGDRVGAVAGLDEARMRLGPVVSLDLFAAEAELAARRPQAARERLDDMRARYPGSGPLEELSTRIAAAGAAEGGEGTGRTEGPGRAEAASHMAALSHAGAPSPAEAVAPRRLPRVAAAAATAGAVTVLPRNSVWKYNATGTDLGTAWRGTGYNDGSWPSGPGALGYNDGYIVTPVPYGPSSSNRYPTTYFRTTFTVSVPIASIRGLTMGANYDDGFVAYINGVEVARRSLPAGPISYTTFASDHEGSLYEPVNVCGGIGALVQGTNVLAVEVHQASPSSSDLGWDADLAYTDQVVLRGPYLQVGTSSAVTVRWRTSCGTESWVRYGTSPGSLTSSASSATPVTEHEVRVTGLSPNTRYYYSIGNAGGPLAGDATYTFLTPPVPGTPLATRIWVVGDSGQPGANAYAVRDAYAAWTGTRPTNLWLMLGDNAYPEGTDNEYQAGVFDQYPVMLRQSVMWPTRGNHDQLYGAAFGDYYDVFTMPTAGQAGGISSGTEAYYSFDWANIHFICLDSEGTSRAPGSAMLTWLASDIAASPRTWVIAFWHHPPYSKGSHNSDDSTDSGGRLRDMRVNVLPILEAAGVDLVLTGHSHSYERSYLLNGHYGLSSTLTQQMKVDGGDGRVNGNGAYHKPAGGPPPNAGEVFAVAGSSSGLEGGTLNHPAMVASFNLLGSMVLDVNWNRLDARFLSHTGVALDSFTILKSDGVGVEPDPIASRGLQLGPGMPNPFSLDTRLSFTVPRAGPVRLTLLDPAGRRVATLAEGWHKAGVHGARWDGRGAGGRIMPNGVYLAVLEVDGQRVSRKIAHVR